jgi:hypothetical protein
MNIVQRYAKIRPRQYELCRVCGRVTSIPTTMNTELRPYYIPGKGQLCLKCYLAGGYMQDKGV